MPKYIYMHTTVIFRGDRNIKIQKIEIGGHLFKCSHDLPQQNVAILRFIVCLSSKL